MVYEDGVYYQTRRYGSQQRWLIKALREVARSIGRLTEDLGQRQMARRADCDEWSIAEILGYMRDAEREDLDAIRAVLRRDGVRIAERRAQFGPLEHDYRSERGEDLLWEFLQMREELVWLLRDSSEESWERTGRHPYRGAVSLGTLIHEVNERDLDALWRITRIHDALVGAEGRRGSGVRRPLR